MQDDQRTGCCICSVALHRRTAPGLSRRREAHPPAGACGRRSRKTTTAEFSPYCLPPPRAPLVSLSSRSWHVAASVRAILFSTPPSTACSSSCRCFLSVSSSVFISCTVDLSSMRAPTTGPAAGGAAVAAAERGASGGGDGGAAPAGGGERGKEAIESHLSSRRPN